MTRRLRVVVATPVSDEGAQLIEAIEPRIDLVRDAQLLPPMRYPGDFQGDPAFRRSAASEARFRELVNSAQVLFGIPDADPQALRCAVQSNPDLEWVHTMAAGGGAQVRAAELSKNQLARIAFTSSAGVHAAPLAEFALFGLLAGAKSLPRIVQQQRTHVWSERWAMGQINQQTVLVLGLGKIGIEVARLVSAFGARVTGTSRRAVTVPGVDRVIHPSELLAIAPAVDAIVATLPGTSLTDGLLGQEFFQSLKPGATVVNVGRGSVIDEAALTEALISGRVGFAALDVFASEPLAASSRLWDLPNVLISPHTAALDLGEEQRIVTLFATNARNYLDGVGLANRIDTVEFY